MAKPALEAGSEAETTSDCLEGVAHPNKIQLKLPLDFYSLNPYRMVLWFDSRAIRMSINLSEFCAKKQDLR